MCDVKVYLGKDRQCTAQYVTATHMTVTKLTRKIEGHDHKLYKDSLLSSPELFVNLAKKQIYCCVCQTKQESMPQDVALKSTKRKRGDICLRTRADLTALLWRDRREIYMLTNIYNAPAEGNFF
jgi:hypothetical protein